MASPDMTESNFQFRFAERCLYDYKTNVARLEVLWADLRTLDAISSAKGQTYDAIPCLGHLRDAVSARLERIEGVEQDILHLERRTLPIRRLYDDLREDYILEGSSRKKHFNIRSLGQEFLLHQTTSPYR